MSIDRLTPWDHTVAPVVACSLIAMAILWQLEVLPWVPLLSEGVGLAAVGVAPGLATEPCFRGKQWRLIERMGLIGAISFACTAVAGVGMHVVSVPISTTNVLLVLFVTSLLLGWVSIPLRGESSRLGGRSPGSVERAIAIASVALLAGAFAAILILRPPPAPPRLEAALVSTDGTLLVQPLQMTTDSQQHLAIALRSTIEAPPTVRVSLVGPAVGNWSIADFAANEQWNVVRAPIVTSGEGLLRAAVHIQGPGVDLNLPIEIHVTQE